MPATAGDTAFPVHFEAANVAPSLTIGQFSLIESFVSCTLSPLVGIVDCKHSIGATHVAV